MSTTTVMEQILELARWAPSGDNVQSWTFELADAMHLVIHASDTRDDCVYDLDGHPSQISFGALIETIAVAASLHGLRADVTRRMLPPSEEARPVFDVKFVSDPKIMPDPLAAQITERTVQRGRMHTAALTAQQKRELEDAVGPDYRIDWFESIAERKRMARLMFNNAKLRLTMPEAYEVHKRIIHWNADRSTHGVPDQALGVNAGTLRLMRWAMRSWRRMSVMNTLMGTWAPRMEMDYLPSIFCAAHYVIKARQAPRGIDDYVAAGRALQRFWLTLTGLGLFMQPEMTPLIFSKYAREKVRFTAARGLPEQAAKLQLQTEELLGGTPGYAVYMGRIGTGPAPTAWSERKPLSELMKTSGPTLA